MITIDGSFGEGGGSIIRLAVAFSNITKQAVKIENIRLKRRRPGLSLQHLRAIELIANITNGKLSKAEIGSQKVTFIPGKDIKENEFDVNLETAASISLLLQAVVLSTLYHVKPLKINIKGGGTNGMWAPTIDYFKQIKIPILKLFNYDVDVDVIKHGFYPKGMANVKIKINPLKNHNINSTNFNKFQLEPKKEVTIYSIASNQLKKAKVAERQVEGAKRILSETELIIKEKISYIETESIGTAVTCVTDGFPIGGSAVGKRGLAAEKVGKIAAKPVYDTIKNEANVDEYLVDQLIPYLVQVNNDEEIILNTSKISKHTTTNIWLAEKFFPEKKITVRGNKIHFK